jgi:hypothetical protein
MENYRWESLDKISRRHSQLLVFKNYAPVQSALSLVLISNCLERVRRYRPAQVNSRVRLFWLRRTDWLRWYLKWQVIIRKLITLDVADQVAWEHHAWVKIQPNKTGPKAYPGHLNEERTLRRIRPKCKERFEQDRHAKLHQFSRALHQTLQVTN